MMSKVNNFLVHKVCKVHKVYKVHGLLRGALFTAAWLPINTVRRTPVTLWTLWTLWTLRPLFPQEAENVFYREDDAREGDGGTSE